MEEGQHKLNWSKCIRCGECTKECYAKALTKLGRTATAQEIIDEVLRDKIFYEGSGGITLSGGEPMLQRDFVESLLSLAKEHSLHTTLETSALYDYSCLTGVKDNVDLFYVDFKISDPEVHKKLTGADNAPVYENLKKLHEENRTVLIRCPIIPGVNDTDEHFEKIAELTEKFTGFIGAELLPYHRLGVSKIDRYGLKGEIPYAEYKTATKEIEQSWIDTVRKFGGKLVNEDVT